MVTLYIKNVTGAIYTLLYFGCSFISIGQVIGWEGCEYRLCNDRQCVDC